MTSARHPPDTPQGRMSPAFPHVVDDPPDLGLYVHFPWCVKKCPYCDFNSHPLNGELQEDAYVRAVTREFRTRVGDAGQYDSVFFGGGTPSLFSARALGSLIDTFMPYLRDGAEITMEANPGATERGSLAACRDVGINRLSIGAQSFSPEYLERLGRIHGPDETRACIEAARRGGFDNVNLDIMYGLPGQSAEEALADLEAAIAQSPDHLSWYQLTIEPRTEFARRPPRHMPGEEVISKTEDAGRALLEGAGYHRYEVSAYARAGAACLHNLVYWTFGDYVGLGAGAHGKQGAPSAAILQPPPARVAHQLPAADADASRKRGRAPSGRLDALATTVGERCELGALADTPADAARAPTIRTRNPRQPRLYLQDPCHAEPVPVGPDELPGEFMMNALRLVGGVERNLFETRTGLPWSTVEATWEKTTNLGLTESGRIAATAHGLQHLDTVVQYFL